MKVFRNIEIHFVGMIKLHMYQIKIRSALNTPTNNKNHLITPISGDKTLSLSLSLSAGSKISIKLDQSISHTRHPSQRSTRRRAHPKYVQDSPSQGGGGGCKSKRIDTMKKKKKKRRTRNEKGRNVSFNRNREKGERYSVRLLNHSG